MRPGGSIFLISVRSATIKKIALWAKLEEVNLFLDIYDMLGGMGGRPSPSRIRPPADPKDPPLYYFEISIFADGP